MEQRVDVFCHILPRRYDEARWRRSKKGEFVDYSPSHLKYTRKREIPQQNYQALADLEARFRILDEFPNYRQVLTVVAPPIEVIDPDGSDDLAKIANDELAELVQKYPHYFAGAVASLPLNKPDAALREVERAIRDLKLGGVQLFSNVLGKPLDLPEFRPIFRMMSEYDLPILLHPARSRKHPDYLTESHSKYLIWQVFGWPYESTAAMARIVFGGILEEYPNLKIIVHHTGAMVSFFHGRLSAMYSLFEPLWVEERGGPLKRPVVEYFRSFYADTATFTSASIQCAADFFGVDHVLFGTDAPMDLEGGRFSIRESTTAIESSTLTAEEKDKIFYKNFQALFRSAST